MKILNFRSRQSFSLSWFFFSLSQIKFSFSPCYCYFHILLVRESIYWDNTTLRPNLIACFSFFNCMLYDTRAVSENSEHRPHVIIYVLPKTFCDCDFALKIREKLTLSRRPLDITQKCSYIDSWHMKNTTSNCWLL